MDFDDEMMKALALDAGKLESMGMPQPSISGEFYCRKCGCSGEEKFSWDGECLVCEAA